MLTERDTPSFTIPLTDSSVAWNPPFNPGEGSAGVGAIVKTEALEMTDDREIARLRELLCQAVGASAEQRERLVRILRAAVILLEEDGSPALSPPRFDLSPAMAHAAREISEQLGLVADHAAFLADKAAAFIGTPRPA